MIKDAKKKNNKKRKRKGGYVPIARANSQFNSISAIVGVKRPCLPDAVAMAMAEEGIDVSVAEAHAVMPFAREDARTRQFPRPTRSCRRSTWSCSRSQS